MGAEARGSRDLAASLGADPCWWGQAQAAVGSDTCWIGQAGALTDTPHGGPLSDCTPVTGGSFNSGPQGEGEVISIVRLALR